MVRKNRLKAKLKAGGIAFGCSIGPDEVGMVEMAGALGFDYIMIDWEHYLFDARLIEEAIRCADVHRMTSIVRMQLNPEHIMHVLGAGAQGVLVARVNTPEDVRTILDAAKFHPEGRRTLFFNGRGHNFRMDIEPGQSQQAFTQDVNRETMIGCIIEEITGVNNLDKILAFPEIDMIHLGPMDLAHSMHWPAKEESDRAGEKIVAESVKAGKAMSTTWGARAGTSEDANVAGIMAQGYRMFTVSPRAYFKVGGAHFLRFAREVAQGAGIST
jgi:2-keto-3-deoxy-L-rhamnonate aldolase RhmA